MLVKLILRVTIQISRTDCTHLHPGYGFLSENPSLAVALPNSVVFVGPSVECLRIASDKILSRNLAVSLGVNVAPGGRIYSVDDVRAFADSQGYPVMLKALDGGGGRGIRIVKAEGTIEEAFKRYLCVYLYAPPSVSQPFFQLPWRIPITSNIR